MENIKQQLSQINKVSKKSVALYHKVAVSCGISDSALGILYTLSETEQPCSQYDLSREHCLPKQTVNSAVSALQSKGIVALLSVPNTRNKKNVVLTETGKNFAAKVVSVIRRAEMDALATLTPEERETYVRLNEKYN